MSTDNTAMLTLLKQQEQERQNLAAATYKAWQMHQEAEKRLLAPYNGQYEHAPQKVKETCNQGRKEFWQEWGSKGRLATLMNEKHQRERESIIKRTNILEQVKQARQLNRTKSKDHERDD